MYKESEAPCEVCDHLGVCKFEESVRNYTEDICKRPCPDVTGVRVSCTHRMMMHSYRSTPKGRVKYND